MQPVYLYRSDFDREVQWRSNFSSGIPILLGFLQLLLTGAIIGLEIASVVISPIYGTLYAGFWSSVAFTLSWVSMFGLVCCHRARRWAIYLFLISLLCAAVAITLIVLDALFISNITRCFFANVICNDLRASNGANGQPLGKKLPILKGQLACAAVMVATAVVYLLLFIIASFSSRSNRNVVLVEHHQMPTQHIRMNRRVASPTSPRPWKTATVPITYEPSQVECPNCNTSIRLQEKKRYVPITN